jgi:hypothetical protein
MPTAVEILLQNLDRAFDRKSWHGANLRGSIRGLSAQVAAWRPSAKRRNIWEIVVHAAYWKYTVRRRLLRQPRGSFPLKGSNWFTRPTSAGDSESQWAADVKLLTETHRELRAAVAGLSERDLARKLDGGSVSVEALTAGIAAHDLYHAGQIQLLKKLQEG